MGFDVNEAAGSVDTPRLAYPSSASDPASSVLTEDDLTEIRVADIAFGDASDLGWD